MTQIQEAGENLPSLDDFSESSLLDQITTEGKEEEEGEEETPEEKEAREAEEAEEAKLEAEKAKLAAEEQEEDELTEEEKEAKAKAEAEESEEEGSFWDDVDALTGNKYEVDYGDVDPDSPEGAVIREEVVTKRAVEENLAYLEETFPEGFKALMHVSNGGKINDLIGSTTTDYKAIDAETVDADGQKAFMKSYYMEKGFSEAKALRNVEDDEDSEEGLGDNFKAALKEKQDGQEAETKAAFEKQEAAKAAQDAQDRKFGETLSSVINTGKIGNFQVAKKDAESFYKHVISHVQRDGDGYALTIPLTNDNFQSQLQQMFFGFKKGDLSKFVKAEATTQNSKRLKRSLQKEGRNEESSSEDGTRKRGKKLPTLGEFEE